MGRAREQARRTLCFVAISTRSLRAAHPLMTTRHAKTARAGAPVENAGSLTPFEMTSLIDKTIQTDPLPRRPGPRFSGQAGLFLTVCHSSTAWLLGPDEPKRFAH